MMKQISIRLLVACILVIPCLATAQFVSSEAAASKALTLLHSSRSNMRELTIQPLRYNGVQSAWLIINTDKRFVVVSADSLLQPVLAYGDSIADMNSIEFSTWQRILTSDYNNRLQAVQMGYIPSQKATWSETQSRLFQQWPPAGTTSTGGWLNTNWTQSSPYNKLCPMDLNAGSRSYVGCPATAMAQICNYYTSINNTLFSDEDDYYHSFGSGNSYWIDDAHAERSFPDFPELNGWLDTIRACYEQGIPLSDSMKAALSFAAGVAAHQVYSASGSGTFGIDQAQMAYQRFNFDLSELLLPSDPDLTSRVADDMKAAMVDHLGIVDAAVTVGHNVVVDGYNTDDYFHFNFGWGGGYNGWYTLPPAGMPYNMNVIEGIVVNIKNTYTGTKPAISNAPGLHFAFSQENRLRISGINCTGTCELKLFTTSGALVLTREFTATQGSDVTLIIPGLSSGLYLCRIQSPEGSHTGKAIKPW